MRKPKKIKGSEDWMFNFNNKRDLLKLTGDISQLFGVKEYVMKGGMKEGTRVLEANNGSGLIFSVLPDRGLDISYLSYKGINMSYISKTGVVGPQFYESRGLGFHRSFFGGFLTTCGLRNVGTPVLDDEEEFELHGRISHIPAEEVYSYVEWTEKGPVIKIGGKMREARLFGEHLTLKREISVEPGCNIININDVIENEGFKDEIIMLLYHFNLGYPFVDKCSYFICPTKKVEPRDEDAAAGKETYDKCHEPVRSYKEQVFYHEPEADECGNTYAGFVNPELNIKAIIKFNKNQLCNITQWKQLGEGEYVIGIEPCNCRVEGRVKQRQRGDAEILRPGEKKTVNLKVEIS